VLAAKEAGAPGSSARSHSARYHRPYLAHGSIGPSAAAALSYPDGRLEVWSHSQGVHALRRELAAALDLSLDRVVVRHAEPPVEWGGGTGRNSVPGYDFPSYRVTNHLLTGMPLRTSALRSLGAFVNVFAAESFMDELAAAAGRDPLEFRLAHLSDPRGRAVLRAAASRAGWSEWAGRDALGHGIGYARYKNSAAYCAVVAEVEAVEEVRVRRLVIGVDAGLVINPDGAANQIEGGAVQTTSWTLKERVRFDRFNVTSDTWETYPILRFSEVPAVEVEFVGVHGNPPLGVRECAQGPTAAAIANARLRRAGRLGAVTAPDRRAADRRDAGIAGSAPS
jgi:nicotinate dehydrogenase subunit B